MLLNVLLDHVVAVLEVAAVEGVKFIFLDDGDELGGVVDILGISAIPQSLCPTAVVGHVKLVEHAVAGTFQEFGMVQERILGGAILTVAHLFERVTCPVNLSAPVIGLDAEVVVGLLGHLALAHAALENALG